MRQEIGRRLPTLSFISTENKRVAPRKTTATGPGYAANGQVDISKGGVCVEIPYVLDVTTECEIDINLDACGTTYLIRLYGRVCYSVQMAERVYRTGMQFIRMRTEVAAQLTTPLE